MNSLFSIACGVTVSCLLLLLAKVFWDKRALSIRLSKSEALYKTIMANEAIGTVVAGIDGPIYEANDAFLKIIGYSRKDVETGRLRWDTITPSEYVEVDRQKVQELQETGFGKEYEKQFFHKDGHRVDVWISRISRIEKTENLVTSCFLDITEYKKVERSLLDSEARFNRVIEGSNDGYWEWELQTGLVYWSDRVFAMLGEARQSNYVSFGVFANHLPDKDRASVEAVLQHCIQSGKPLNAEFKMRHHQGHYIDCLSRAKPYYNEAGQVVRLAGSFSDITEQKQIREALLKSEARFRQLFDSNLLGVAFWNIYGKIYEANDTFLKILGYTRKDVEAGSLNWQILTLPEDQRTQGEFVQQAIQGEAVLPYETRFIHKERYKVDVLVGYAMLEGSREQGFVFVLDISERKRAEQALRESEQRFRFMAASMPQKVWTTLPSGEMNYMNQNWFDYTGRDWEALRDLQWLEIVHPDDRAETARIWHDAVKTKVASQVSHRLRRFDGQYRWHLSRGAPSWSEEGHLILWVGTSTDIDDLKQVQASLMESEERFRSLADSVPFLIWLSDDKGHNTYTNKTCSDFTGRGHDEFVKQNWLDFIHPDDRDRIIQTMMKAVEHQEEYHFQYRVLRHDGQYKWMQVIGLPRFTSEGKMAGYVGSAFDITEQKEVNQILETRIQERTQQLQKSNRLLASVIENVPAVVFLKDAKELRFELCNKAGKELIGLTDIQLVGKNDYEVFPKGQAEFFIAKDRETLERGTLVDISEEPLQTVMGEVRYLHTKKVPIMDEEGRPAYLLGISEDITEIKKNQEQIQMLNRQLEEQIRSLNAVNKELESFSYTVSHDLRAPLRTIDGFSQAVLEDYSGRLDEDGKRYLERIREGSQQMAQLIDDMLNLSRLSRGELKKEAFSLSNMVQRIAQDLQTHEPNRKVNFVIQEGLHIEADKRLMQAVMENLLGNAWKFTSHHETALIEFGAFRENERTVYFVKDDGAGFDMIYADKLFGTFQRLHNTAEFAGTGVGLASVQRVIHRHGGEIWTYGEVEKGATFYFTV